MHLKCVQSDYLEYKFGTIKCYNGRNKFIVPFIVRIPFYVWIGCSRSRDTTKAIQAFEIEAGNRVIVSMGSVSRARVRLANTSYCSHTIVPSFFP